MKQTKVYYLIGAVLLLIFAGFSYSEFKDSLTPYVPFDVARKADRTVQVAGGLEKGTSSYDEESGILSFGLVDKETQQVMRVRYDGLKPANFEDAVSIVAIGRYDKATQELEANKLLVKCPSKYQGLESVDMEKSYE